MHKSNNCHSIQQGLYITQTPHNIHSKLEISVGGHGPNQAAFGRKTAACLSKWHFPSFFSACATCPYHTYTAIPAGLRRPHALHAKEYCNGGTWLPLSLTGVIGPAQLP